MTEQDYYRPFDQPVAPWGPPPPPVPPKVKHTKGWAIGWAIAFAVMTLIATFWLVAAGVEYNKTRCGYDTTQSMTVCVASNGDVSY